MSKTPAISIYEEVFAKSDKSDAILVVDGKKLHVNKALLSCHSEYFNTLFTSNFKEKSIEEIEIKDVNFEDFAAVLSLVHPYPLVPTDKNALKLLELADQFLLPAAKRHVDLFLTTTKMAKFAKLRIADRYDLDILRDHAISMFTAKKDFEGIHVKTEHFSKCTKSKLFERYFYLVRNGYFSL